MSKQSSKKGGGGKKGGKKRIVIQLPSGSPLDAMSQDEMAKHVQDLVGKAGIIGKHVGGRVEELHIEIGDSSSAADADSSSATALRPPDGWGARWSRRCAT